MAKSEIMIRGRIGNMIFYRVKGVTRIRSVPLSTGKPDSSKCRSARLRLIAAVRFYQRLQDSRFRDIWRMAAKDSSFVTRSFGTALPVPLILIFILFPHSRVYFISICPL